MGTAATPTKIQAGAAYGGHFEGIFELDLDTTDADGYNTIDLTTWFSEVFAILDGGSENEHGYVPKFTVPDNGVAASATNCQIGIFEAGADGDALDAVVSTDVSSYITKQRIIVKGKQVI